MPTILRADGYRIFFYSDEGTPREPPHVHISSGEKTAKFWLDPVRVAGSARMNAAEINRLRLLVEHHQSVFLEAWNAHFRT